MAAVDLASAKLPRSEAKLRQTAVEDGAIETSVCSEDGAVATNAVFATLLKSYRTIPGRISAAREGLGLLEAREQLLRTGFAAAPNSGELVKLLNAADPEDLHRAGAEFMKCCGVAEDCIKATAAECGDLNGRISSIVLESLRQLEQVLPPESVVVGPLEGAFRGQRGGISWLHKDEHRTSDVYLEQTLFPSTTDMDPTDFFRHYNALRSQLGTTYSELNLPASSECNLADDGALRAFTNSIIAAFDEYHASRENLQDEELILDFINVWIPKRSKRLALLPMTVSRGVCFEGDTRPCVEEIEAGGYSQNFQTFSIGTSILFFGRHVLHQVAEGEAFAPCLQGSMETRYLILTPRRSTHRYALYRESCISRTVVKELAPKSTTAWGQGEQAMADGCDLWPFVDELPEL